MKEVLGQALFCTIVIILIIFVVGRLIDILVELFVRGMGKLTNMKLALFFANWVTFIGTVHHELSHALFAFVMGARIKKIELFRPREQSLGMVEIVPRGNKILQSLQLSLSAIAPMVMGTVTECLLWSLLSNHEFSLGLTIFIYYVMISIVLHMTMSPPDIKCALRGLLFSGLIMFIIWFIILYFGKGDFVTLIKDCYYSFVNLTEKFKG